MKYDAYDELMSYFNFEFNIYVLLVLIVTVGLIKTMTTYREVKKLDDAKNLPNVTKKYDVIISLLAILGLTSAMFFQGVISDIPLESGHAWVDKSMYLYIASIVLFIGQLVVMSIIDKRIKVLRESE